MPKGLRRWYGGGDLHYITYSCYERRPFLGSPSARDLFLKVFEQVRWKYEFQVVGYVVMPEHIHLLIGEPDERKHCRRYACSKATRISAMPCPRPLPFDGRRFRRPSGIPAPMTSMSFSEKKVAEKLDYIHWNPVKRGLVASPEQWRWRSYRYYALMEAGPVKIGG